MVKKGTGLVTALKILEMPEGPTYRELQRQARVYLRSLSPEQYSQLETEALKRDEEAGSSELAAYKYRLFKSMHFSDIEARAYCYCRLNAPGTRRVIARRALLVKEVGERVLKGLTHFQLVRMEDERGLGRLSFDDMMRRLV